MPKFEEDTPTIEAAISRQTKSKHDKNSTRNGMEIGLPSPAEAVILNHQRRLMSARQLAEALNVSLSWVNKSHCYGTGPPRDSRGTAPTL
jgi:hypothetical protein